MAILEDKWMRPGRHYLETMMNAVLSMDPESCRELSSMKGRTIVLEVIDTPFSLCIEVAGTGILLRAGHETGPDVTLRGTAPGLIGFLHASLREKSRAPASIEVIGDVNLAQEFQSVMKKFEPDWEEALSRWIGDTAARKFGNFVRDAARTMKKGLRTIELDISEYLRFEAGSVPDRSEVDEFFSSVDELRNDVERLKIRIAKLGRV